MSINGCWVVYSYDVGPQVHEIHSLEIEALRAANRNGVFESVAFIPWGAEVVKAIEEYNKAKHGVV